MSLQGALASQFSESALKECQQALNAAAVHIQDESDLKAVQPKIVVVGDQSSGKSSALSRIAGVDLPTGHRLCTRCPLQLELRNCQNSRKAYAKISYNPPASSAVRQRPLEISEIQGAIHQAQIGLAGNGSEISSVPIRLEVFSPNSPDLTIIDLPGLIQTKGDGQPDTVVEQIDSLTRKEIAGKYTVILCVVSAAVDIQNNKAINFAQEADKEGARTLGIITKCDRYEGDLADKAREDCRLVPCGQGYCLLRGRSPDDEKAGMSLSEAAVEEQRFFDSRMQASLGTFGLKATVAKLMNLAADALCKAAPDCIHVVNNHLARVQAEQSHHQQSRVTSLDQVTFVLANFASRIKDEFDNVDRSDMRGIVNPRSPGHREVNAHLKRAAAEFKHKVEEKTGGVTATTSPETLARIEEELARVTGKYLPTMWPPSVLTTVYMSEIHGHLLEPVEWLQDKAREIVQCSLDAIIEVCIPEEAIRASMQAAMKGVLHSQARSLQATVDCQMTCYAFVYSYDEEKYLDVQQKLEDESKSRIKKICDQAEPVANAVSLVAGPEVNAAVSGAKEIADMVENGQEEPASSARDCQRMLSAYTALVLEDIADRLPRLCRYHLIHQVLDILRNESPNPLICNVDQRKAFEALQAGGRQWAQLDERLQALQAVRDKLHSLTGLTSEA